MGVWVRVWVWVWGVVVVRVTGCGRIMTTPGAAAVACGLEVRKRRRPTRIWRICVQLQLEKQGLGAELCLWPPFQCDTPTWHQLAATHAPALCHRIAPPCLPPPLPCLPPSPPPLHPQRPQTVASLTAGSHFGGGARILGEGELQGCIKVGDWAAGDGGEPRLETGTLLTRLSQPETPHAPPPPLYTVFVRYKCVAATPNQRCLVVRLHVSNEKGKMRATPLPLPHAWPQLASVYFIMNVTPPPIYFATLLCTNPCNSPSPPSPLSPPLPSSYSPLPPQVTAASEMQVYHMHVDAFLKAASPELVRALRDDTAFKLTYYFGRQGTIGQVREGGRGGVCVEVGRRGGGEAGGGGWGGQGWRKGGGDTW